MTVLENTRFDPGETKNDEAFARELADGCDLYVNDAFGSAHRAHASTEGVAHLLPAYAGLLLLDELEHLGALLGEVERPFVIVSGGAKVEDKIGVLENLGSRADARADRRQDGRGRARREPVLVRRRCCRRDVVAADVVRRRRRDAGRAVRRRCPRAGSGSTSGPRRARSSRAAIARREDRLLERPDGRLRVAALRRGHVRRRARASPTATASRSSAAATRCAPCTRRASPTASRGSRPAAARRSSCSRARSCPAWPRSRSAVGSMLIAGNWKMFKGPRRGGRVLPRRCATPTSATSTSSSARRTSRSTTAVQALAGTEIGVFAQNVPLGARGRVHRRDLARRCCASSASTARSSATPSGASTSARPTRPSRAACAAALEHGLHVIACVGETEAEREAGRDRGGAPPPGRRVARAPDDEPRHRVRAGVGDRHRQDRDAGDRAGGARVRSSRCSTCRCSTAARSSRRTRPSCSRSRPSTARSSAARPSTSNRSPRFAAHASRS